MRHFHPDFLGKTELINCKNCGERVNGTFELCPKCGKGLRRDYPAFEAKTVVNQPVAKLTIPEPQPKSSKVVIIIGLAVVAAIIGIGVMSNAPSKTESTQQVGSARFNGNCAGITSTAEDALNVLGGLGVTTTVGDALTSLQKNADLFEGYSNFVSSPSQRQLLGNIAMEMREIRVVLTDGGDLGNSPALLGTHLGRVIAACSS